MRQLVVSVVLTCSLGISGRAAAEPSAPVALVSPNGLCLDLDFDDLKSNKNGGKVHVWTCNRGVTQLWRFDGERVLAMNGKCLDVHQDDYAAKNNGGRVSVWDCNGAPNQKWTRKGDTLVSANSLCLDLNGPDSEAKKVGGKVQLWGCSSSENQRWVSTEVVGPLVNRKKSMCLDPAWSDGASGQNVSLYGCDNGVDQAFALTDAGTLVSQAQKVCLDVQGSRGAAGDDVLLYSCDSATDQRWKLKYKTEGWFEVVNEKNGVCLDAVGTAGNEGDDVRLAACDGKEDQQWQFKDGPLQRFVNPTVEAGASKECVFAMACLVGGVQDKLLADFCSTFMCDESRASFPNLLAAIKEGNNIEACTSTVHFSIDVAEMVLSGFMDTAGKQALASASCAVMNNSTKAAVEAAGGRPCEPRQRALSWVNKACSQLSYMRDQGVPMTCPANEEMVGALCYPRCPSGMGCGDAAFCRTCCPGGYQEFPLTCTNAALHTITKESKPRPVGKPVSACTGGRERSGALCYKPCMEGYRGEASVCWKK